VTKPLLTKRYNADQTLTILCRGRVVIKFGLGDHRRADDFAKGWFGDDPIRWGKTQFSARTRKNFERELEAI
jgi:hypothetical protein